MDRTDPAPPPPRVPDGRPAPSRRGLVWLWSPLRDWSLQEVRERPLDWRFSLAIGWALLSAALLPVPLVLADVVARGFPALDEGLVFFGVVGASVAAWQWCSERVFARLAAVEDELSPERRRAIGVSLLLSGGLGALCSVALLLALDGPRIP